MATSRLKIGLIGVTVAGAAMIICSHLMMGNVDNMVKDRDIANKDNNSQTSSDNGDRKTSIRSIRLRIGDEVFAVFMDSNDAAQEFAEGVPFELDMKELNGNEKYYSGNDKLPTKDAYQPGKIKAGDLMLYGNDTIVLFYKDLETNYSYTRLGWVQDAYKLADLLGDDDITIIFTKQ